MPGKLSEDARVTSLEEVARLTWLMRLEAPGISRLARAGQFVMARVRDGLDPLLRRPLSFHRIFPGEGVIELLFRTAGRGTWLLSQTLPGSTVNLIGPLGNGFDLPPAGEPSRVAVVAGGIGVAPLMELMAQLRSTPNGGRRADVRLFYGARTADELLPASVFEEFDIPVSWSTDDGSLGREGNVVGLLADCADREGFQPSVVYSCGPLAMQYHTARWALDKNIPAQLSLESLMACGIGACLGCALPAVDPDDPTGERYLHVCKDGPIFPAGSIQWNRIQAHRTPPPIFLCS